MLLLRTLITLLFAIGSYTSLNANECSQECQVPPPCGQERSCGCVITAPCCCYERNCNYRSDYYHACGYWAFGPNDCCSACACGKRGVWMPECPPLFRPFAADPRQLTYSAGWRWNDEVTEKETAPVSFYDTFPVYRWCNVWPFGGQMQFDVEGAVWAIFAPLLESAPLINADYYVGFPLTYAIDCWSFRLRVYHISSHLGDEFLINNPGFDRRNPSAEYVDFFASWQFSRQIRYYLGVGYIFHQDRSFPVNPFYMEGGFEVRALEWGFLSCANQLYGTPFLAIHWRYNPDFTQHVDLTYALGYEFGKLCGLGRKARFWLEYHDGYSVEGQFSRRPTNYLSVNACYGF